MREHLAIRPAIPNDAEAMIACISAAYAPFRTRGVQLPPVEDGIAADIADNLVWVAEGAEGVCAGIVTIAGNTRFKIANLFVTPKAQGQGLARKLLHEASAQARALGYTAMWLTTHVDMKETITLYHHLGWQEHKRDGNKLYMVLRDL